MRRCQTGPNGWVWQGAHICTQSGQAQFVLGVPGLLGMTEGTCHSRMFPTWVLTDGSEGFHVKKKERLLATLRGLHFLPMEETRKDSTSRSCGKVRQAFTSVG